MAIERTTTWEEINGRPNYNEETGCLHFGTALGGCNAGQYEETPNPRICGDSIEELKVYAKSKSIELRTCGRCRQGR